MTRRPPARSLVAALALTCVGAGCAGTAELAEVPAGAGVDDGAGWQVTLPPPETAAAVTTVTSVVSSEPPVPSSSPVAVTTVPVDTAVATSTPSPSSATSSTTSTAAPLAPPTTTSAPNATSPAPQRSTVVTATPSTTDPVAAAAAPVTAGATSCTSVLHIGDSTSVGATSAAYLPDPSERLDARYRDVGVEDVEIDASPGRSIVETRGTAGNAEDVARAARARGYHGCWVIAVGTNDAANIGAGAMVGAAARIDRVMALVGDDPVLWVDAVTFTDDGAWARSNMAAWNAALADAVRRYPRMHVFAWSAVARPDWFGPDGVHEVAAGSRQQALHLAAALADAFPADTLTGD